MAKEVDLKQFGEKAKSWFSGVRKILRAIGLHAFLTILIIVIIEVAAGAFLMYKYVIVALREEPEINNANFQFKDASYNKLLEEWNKKDKALEDFLKKDYTNPF